MAVRSLSLPVVGSAYPNNDGSSRKFEVLLCQPGEALTLLREPKNKYDEHAVAVFSERGTQIGYISSERAVFVAGLLRNGHDLIARFQRSTEWGAIIRIGIDGEPEMPSDSNPAHDDRRAHESDDGFWPDYIPSDD